MNDMLSRLFGRARETANHTLREINSHHNYNTSTFFSSNQNLEFG